MIKVKIARNYSYPDLFRQTPNESAVWDNILFTEEDITDADFVIVLNHPSRNLKIRSSKGGTWLFLQEPPYDQKSYFKLYFRFVDRVYSGFPEDITNNFNAQTGLPWHINKSYDFLMQLKPEELQKNDRISWITSTTNTVPGHQRRLEFLNTLLKNKFEFDLYGRGFAEIEDKFDGLASYKYSIAVENYFSNDYFTEKAIDCFLSWTMPIYYGCTNFEKYFPKNSFISIDINQPEKSIEIINQAVAEKAWEKNIDAICEARTLILNKYQFFPLVAERIKEFYAANPKPEKRIYKIPASGLTLSEEIKKRIRKIIPMK